MSELKVIDLGDIRYAIENDKPVYYEYYAKSEADKVIALLKDKANYNETAYKIKSEELADTCRFYEDEIRHQKYKRCKAMAAKYLWKRNYWRDSTPAYERQHQWENMAYKHYKRWLELAEKFKEAK